MQCKPLDTWSTHSSEAKRCVVNTLTSSDSIIRATFSRYWMSLKRFAGRNASFYKWKTNQCLAFDPHEGAAHNGDPAFIKLWSGFSEENHLDLAPFLPSERQLTEREREMCRPSGFPDHTTFRNLTSVLVKQQNFLTRQEKKNKSDPAVWCRKDVLADLSFWKTGNEFVFALCLTSTPNEKKEKSSNNTRKTSDFTLHLWIMLSASSNATPPSLLSHVEL